jgi:hypothetical protein
VAALPVRTQEVPDLDRLEVLLQGSRDHWTKART